MTFSIVPSCGNTYCFVCPNNLGPQQFSAWHVQDGEWGRPISRYWQSCVWPSGNKMNHTNNQNHNKVHVFVILTYNNNTKDESHFSNSEYLGPGIFLNALVILTRDLSHKHLLRFRTKGRERLGALTWLGQGLRGESLRGMTTGLFAPKVSQGDPQ